ncbi:hypothetical protein PHIM7_52 [Sinorhizobium phage phiM7]|uniref:Uncharacterized protein n=3 Tax=Emdodecavirus TaxID=1980937 RepID=S5MCS6_9CAUD|nr:hypothetical protein AB690_gp059 [Sinorhizobium phage phiM12]YP_009212308.1 hypothetical protein AVT40_gp068 [Sinorhizobium phage phiN3]YP_009601177.1 hypothetical protein FDH46_gp052 [Sinorhizobium phage phiM7]AKF12960.1 hypothetical protein PHIM19_53 [Sinorhizobium phage phiM19]AGR47704.1 hypothetical protein SmphiM12_072 [Sinorhizobium phage phiM12]AKF12600.1 hypothetical protein PHIM7_52 [Sinorhizobium phage phiM7]AKF13333.1 hypothetical protein PHIN3_68 [Sinorhizobium phage phiN3]
MSKALEMVKMAREGNASRFGDAFVAGVQERVAAAIDAKRTTMTVKEEVQTEEGKSE